MYRAQRERQKTPNFQTTYVPELHRKIHFKPQFISQAFIDQQVKVTRATGGTAAADWDVDGSDPHRDWGDRPQDVFPEVVPAVIPTDRIQSVYRQFVALFGRDSIESLCAAYNSTVAYLLNRVSLSTILKYNSIANHKDRCLCASLTDIHRYDTDTIVVNDSDCPEFSMDCSESEWQKILRAFPADNPPAILYVENAQSIPKSHAQQHESGPTGADSISTRSHSISTRSRAYDVIVLYNILHAVHGVDSRRVTDNEIRNILYRCLALLSDRGFIYLREKTEANILCDVVVSWDALNRILDLEVEKLDTYETNTGFGYPDRVYWLRNLSWY